MKSIVRLVAALAAGFLLAAAVPYLLNPER